MDFRRGKLSERSKRLSFLSTFHSTREIFRPRFKKKKSIFTFFLFFLFCHPKTAHTRFFTTNGQTHIYRRLCTPSRRRRAFFPPKLYVIPFFIFSSALNETFESNFRFRISTTVQFFSRLFFFWCNVIKCSENIVNTTRYALIENYKQLGNVWTIIKKYVYKKKNEIIENYFSGIGEKSTILAKNCDSSYRVIFV